MENIKSSLILENLVFEKIEFIRDGFKSNGEVKYRIEVQISYSTDDISRVTLILKGYKEGEYNFTIVLSGYFTFRSPDGLAESLKQDMLKKNATAILMPYLRSELSLLTAQPGMECLALPPFNINKLLDNKSEK